ncbi:sodium:alanine symporter family protein [Veillonella sp. VA137]|uniref:alanine/glycine:cation symporter family protein n=1 Tax=Veillonella sp. VA137 TaxID=741828 RepID=UPI000F8E28F0|nr:alanine/glycine:cation symporter family protein [Veillonella sp. VA137]
MQEQIIQLLGDVNGFLWNNIIIALLIIAGVWFTATTRFVQLRQLPEMFRILKSGAGEKSKGDHHISPFQAFCISVASHVGVGNIAGIAIAIALGGPGAVFWMWFIALLGAATSFIENTLGQIYKERLPDGSFRGGPSYYIRHGLNSPFLSVLFAILISVTYGLIYNSVQANTIAIAVQPWNIDASTTGLIVAALSALVIFGGAKRIAQTAEFLVPFMAGLYFLIALYIVIANISVLPDVISAIFTQAFTIDSATGGFIGAAVMQGIKRGLFSNEAGEGSVPNASASADVNHPVKQGLIMSLGVFVDTMFVCTASAFIVLVSGEYVHSDLTGIALVQHSIGHQLGSWAPAVIALFVFMFAYSSIIGNYFYGEVNIAHMTKNNKFAINLFRALVIIMVYVGCIAELNLVWNLADLFMAFLVLCNITSILRLGKLVTIALKDYMSQKSKGIEDPIFDRTVLPTQKGITWWHKGHENE